MPAWVANLLRGAAAPAALLAALEWYARGPGRDSDALAPPTAALRALAGALGDGSLLAATAFTLASATAGLCIGFAAGALAGVLLGLSARAGRAALLTVEVLRPVPAVALIPLAMLVWGFGWRMESALVAFAVVWPTLVLAQAAARQVPPQLLEVAAGLQLSRSATLAKVVLPAVLPRLFVALRLAVAVALVVAVTAEIAANPHGMGYAIMTAQQSLDPALMLAWLFWIALVGYAVNALALRLERRVARAMGAAAP